MESALIISCAQKNQVFFAKMLSAASIAAITTISDGAEARRLLLTRDSDLVIIDAPLRGEPAEALALHISGHSAAQILLAPENGVCSAIAACGKEGIWVIHKPLSRSVVAAALRFAQASQSRLTRIQLENARLKQKIEEIRLIDRAKCILISNLNMSEQEAHRHIEKQAMDMRATKRTIAEGILKIYSS